MLVEIKRINKEEKIIVSSLDIAETFSKDHKHVLEDVRKIESTISTAEFSALFYKDTYKASNGKKNPMYLMNKDGFTLLVMGYTGPKAMKFKMDYIKQFNAMREMLFNKNLEREKGIAVRQALTKALQQSNENERMHGHAYSNYTNCIYKLLFNKNASQMRKELGLDKKANVRDYLDEEQLKAVKSMEMLVSGLIDCGWGYDKIKDFIQQTNTKLIAN